MPSFVRIFSSLVVSLAICAACASARTNSAILGVNQTTADGSLTLIVVQSPIAKRIYLRNSSARAIIVDAFALSYHLGHTCTGKLARVSADTTALMCTVATPVAGYSAPQIGATPTPNADAGYASLEMVLSWHVEPKASPMATDSPSPWPTLEPNGS